MKACLAEVMGVDEDQISIKATTTEETRIHGQNGGHLRLCHRSYPKRIERKQGTALKGQKLFIFSKM